MSPRRSLASPLIVLALIAAVIGAWALFVRDQRATTQGSQTATRYTCPMHPFYVADAPGDCPICSMPLVPLLAADDPEPSVTLSPAQQQLAGIMTTLVESREAVVVVRARGVVAADERRVAHVHARAAGFITHVNASFVGQPMRRGETLFTLESPELLATQQELLSARRAADTLGAMTHATTHQWAAADQQALVEASRKRLRLLGMSTFEVERLEASGEVQRNIRVVSPIDGVVMERLAFTDGQSVTTDQALYTLADLSSVWAIAQVYERDVASLSVGQEARVRSVDGAISVGRLSFIAPFVNPSTRTVDVRLDLANDAGDMRLDQFVDIEFRRDIGPRLVVPEDAILDSGTTRHAFVSLPGGRLEPRVVETGQRVEGGLVVVSGLAPGDRVVSSAQFVVDAEGQLSGALARVENAPTEPR